MKLTALVLAAALFMITQIMNSNTHERDAQNTNSRGQHLGGAQGGGTSEDREIFNSGIGISGKTP